MSNLIIPQTAAQICQTLSESFTRLIGGYVGPVCTSQDPNSGFWIQNGAGICVFEIGNSSFVFCENNLVFNKKDCDVILCLSDQRNFSILNSGFNFQINSCTKNLILGGQEDFQYRGIQLFNCCPSIVLKDEEPQANVNLKFLNCFNVETFSICNTSYDSSINSFGKLNLKSNGCSSVSISGNYFALNSEINTGYNNFINGNSFLSGNIQTNCNLCLSGFVHSFGATGLISDGQSFFNENVYLNKDVEISGNLNSCGAGSFLALSAQSVSANEMSSSISNFLISSGCALVSCQACVTEISGCSGFYSNFCSVTGSGQCLLIDDLNVFGKVQINSTGFGLINVANLCLNLTGGLSGLEVNSENSIFKGCISSSKNIYVSSIYSTGTGLNTFNGDSKFCCNLITSGYICSCSGFCTIGLTCSQNNYSTYSQTSCHYIDCCLCVSSSKDVVFDYPNCEEFRVKINSGIVFSKNTPKAFGSICFCNGSMVAFTGHNICSVWSPHGKFYSLKFKEPIQAPYNAFFSVERSDYDLTYCTGISSAQNLHCGDLVEYTTIPTVLKFASKCRDINCFVNSSTSPWETRVNGTCYFEQPFIFVNPLGLIDNSCQTTFAGCRIINFFII